MIDMIGGAIGLLALILAWYFWSHESPRLRRQRKLEGEKDLQALRTIVQEEIEKAILKDRADREPGRVTSLTERQRIADIARASAEIATMGFSHVGPPDGPSGAPFYGETSDHPWPRPGSGPESGPGGKPPRR